MAIPSEQCFFIDLFSHILYIPDSEISVQTHDPAAGTISESVVGYDHLEAFPSLWRILALRTIRGPEVRDADVVTYRFTLLYEKEFL